MQSASIPQPLLIFIVPPTENPATQIESALADGNFGLALRIADKLVATSKRRLLGWVSRARANLGLGRICDADEDLDVAIRLAPEDAQAKLLRGMVDHRLGRIDEREDIEDQVAGLQLSQQRELPQRDHVSPRRS